MEFMAFEELECTSNLALKGALESSESFIIFFKVGLPSVAPASFELETFLPDLAVCQGHSHEPPHFA